LRLANGGLNTCELSLDDNAIPGPGQVAEIVTRSVHAFQRFADSAQQSDGETASMW
jgi:hypothetical protein